MINILLSRLQQVKKTSRDQWSACCPAHEDSDPSLRLKQLNDGRVLIHCFGGCGPADVMASIGLGLSDLYPDGNLGEFSPNWYMNSRKPETESARYDRLLLEICDESRRNGKRISQEDMRKEREAWRRTNKRSGYEFP